MASTPVTPTVAYRLHTLDYILPTSQPTSYKLRQCHTLVDERSRLEVRQDFFGQRVVGPWNRLPSHVVEATTVNSFKNRLDQQKRQGHCKACRSVSRPPTYKLHVTGGVRIWDVRIVALGQQQVGPAELRHSFGARHADWYKRRRQRRSDAQTEYRVITIGLPVLQRNRNKFHASRSVDVPLPSSALTSGFRRQQVNCPQSVASVVSRFTLLVFPIQTACLVSLPVFG